MKKLIVLTLLIAAVLIPEPAYAHSELRWNKTEVPIFFGPIGNWNQEKVIKRWNYGPITLVVSPTPCEECITVTRIYPTEELDWAGRATTWNYPGDNTIVKCDIELNGVQSFYSTRSNTLAHEIGHCLGLPHNKLRNSVMSITSRIHPNNRPLPMPHDMTRLNSIYS